MAAHEVILVLDKNVGEINPLTGIEIVRAVNKKDRKLILVNDEFNKFSKIATVVLPTSTVNALEDLVKALSSGAGSEESKRAAALLKAAKNVAIIVPAQLSDNEFTLIRDLAGKLHGGHILSARPKKQLPGLPGHGSDAFLLSRLPEDR